MADLILNQEMMSQISEACIANCTNVDVGKNVTTVNCLEGFSPTQQCFMSSGCAQQNAINQIVSEFQRAIARGVSKI